MTAPTKFIAAVTLVVTILVAIGVILTSAGFNYILAGVWGMAAGWSMSKFV